MISGCLARATPSEQDKALTTYRGPVIDRIMRIGIVGARGMPLPGRNFGGFETFIGGLAPRLAERGHDVTVYCRKALYTDHPSQYFGVRLLWLGSIEGKVLGTPSHSLLAMVDAVRRRFHSLLVVNPANGLHCLIPRVLTRTRILMNVDGVEWKRGKWGVVARSYFRLGAWAATKICHLIVADSQAIAEIYGREFHVCATFIPYAFDAYDVGDASRVRALGLDRHGYYLVVGRLIPENNIDFIVEEFARSSVARRLVVVGGANYSSAFHRRLEPLRSDRIRFLGHVDDMDLLWDLYGHCYAYIHGHSVGGTNPALLQAMATAACPIVFDVIFNRETAGEWAVPFSRKPGDLQRVLEWLDRNPAEVQRRADGARRRLISDYSWRRIVDRYEAALAGLPAR